MAAEGLIRIPPRPDVLHSVLTSSPSSPGERSGGLSPSPFRNTNHDGRGLWPLHLSGPGRTKDIRHVQKAKVIQLSDAAHLSSVPSTLLPFLLRAADGLHRWVLSRHTQRAGNQLCRRQNGSFLLRPHGLRTRACTWLHYAVTTEERQARWPNSELLRGGDCVFIHHHCASPLSTATGLQ